MRTFAIELVSWCWWTLIPHAIRTQVFNILNYPAKRRANTAVNKFLADKSTPRTEEEHEVIEFLQRHPCQMIPYSFALDKRQIKVSRDPDSRLHYVIHAGKRLFFPRTWAPEKIKAYYNGLLNEQHPLSPHRYEADSCVVQEGDIVVDVGASEGLFALDVIERCQKIYLIECDRLWSEPLRKTFVAWEEKVVFLEKWISDRDDSTNNQTTLDSCIMTQEKIGFIKADIEGAEPQLLRGGRRVMDRSDNMRMAICTYHTQTDATSIDALSKAAGFQTCFSHGFMVWGSENGIELRRGVLRAIKCTSPKLSPL